MTNGRSTRTRALLAVALTTALAAGLPAAASGTTEAPRPGADREAVNATPPAITKTIRLADGRRVRVYTEDGHSVFVRRADQPGPYGPPFLIHKADGECRDITLAANSGTVAILLRCYREGTDFTADPVADDSRALVSHNLKNWKRSKAFLSYATVVVSPNGRYAVFSGAPLLVWKHGHGARFTRELLPEDDLAETTSDFVITDDGALTAVVQPDGDESMNAGCHVELWVRGKKEKEFTRSYRSEESFHDGEQSCPFWSRVRLNAQGVLVLIPENYQPLRLKFTRNADGDWVPV